MRWQIVNLPTYQKAVLTVHMIALSFFLKE